MCCRGRGTLIPVPVFEKIGLFDIEHFPQYMADYDFSKRANYAGYKLVVSTKAVVRSIVESTGLNYLFDPTFKTFFTGSVLYQIAYPIDNQVLLCQAAQSYWCVVFLYKL